MATMTSCPKPDQWKEFLLGRLSDPETETLIGHLENCTTCLETVRTVQAEDTLVDVMRSTRLGEPLTDKVIQLMERLAQLAPPSGESPTDATLIGPSDAGEFKDDDLAATGSFHLQDSPQVTEELAGAFLSPAEQSDEIGRIGSYRVLKVLGTGGMGEVYLAEDEHLKRRVALKVMKPTVAMDPVAKQRFLREAQAMAALDHDHIVHVYQVGEDQGVPFVAMQLLKGEMLEQKVRREGRLSVAEILRIGQEAAEGLAAAHEAGLIHRDIKPSNIWLAEPRGRVKILDFGLAHVADADVQLTQSGVIAGTPAYMAPEQARGERVDARCDLFSLGSTLYRMATGEMPFKGTNTTAILLSLVNDQPVPPLEINVEMPDALSQVILKLLEKDPDQRFPTAREVVETLEEIEADLQSNLLESSGVQSGVQSNAQTRVLELDPAASSSASTQILPPEKPSRFSRWRVASGLVFLTVLILLGVVLYIKTNKGTLEIITADPRARITVEKDGKQILIDPGSGDSIRLDVGTWSVRLNDLGDELALESDTFTLKRGGTATVKITRKPAESIPTAKPVSPIAKKLPAVSPDAGRYPPLDPEWVKRVAKLPLAAQVHEVKADLKRRNPLFDTDLFQASSKGGPIDRVIIVNGTDLVDLTSLQAWPTLNSFECTQGQFRDLEALRGLKIRWLTVNESPQFSDIDAIADMPLQWLKLFKTNVCDLSALGGEGMRDHAWNMLDLTGSPVQDLSPLAGLPLRELIGGECYVNAPSLDLSPLAGVPLIKLQWTKDYRLRSLSGLERSTIRDLDIRATGIQDVQALKAMPGLRRLWLSYDPAYEKTLRDLKDLQVINDNAVEKFWENVAQIQLVRKKWEQEKADWIAKTAKLTPDEQVKEITAKLRELNPGFRSSIEIRGGDVLGVSIPGGSTLTEIRPLLALTGLGALASSFDQTSNHEWGVLNDLSAFRGRNFRDVEFANSHVSDLSPLKGMNCGYVNFHHTNVSDFSALENMPLISINMVGTLVKDLTPLKTINIPNLYLEGTSVKDLSPLAGTNIQKLDVSGTKVHDLTPLAKMLSLRELTCTNTQVKDLTPLSETLDMWKLFCDNTPVHNLEPLRGLPLVYVRLNGTDIKDLSPLAECNKLSTLMISDTKVHDLSPLKGLPNFKALQIMNTAVSDLSPLQGMNLTKLSLQRSQVVDLTPLKGMPIVNLGCDHLTDANREIVRQLPLTHLTFYFWPERDAEFIRSIPTLEFVNGMWVKELLKSIDELKKASDSKVLPKTP